MDKEVHSKFKYKQMVVYKGVIWQIGTIWTYPLPFRYELERVYPKGEVIDKIPESELKLWDGKVS